MQTILENEILVGIVGLVIAGLVGYAGIQMGENKMFVAAVALLTVTVALVITSLWIETDREQLRRSMKEIAQSLQANDYEKVFSYLDPNASDGVARARAEVPSYVFHRVRITSVRNIQINDRVNPSAAITQFIAAFEVAGRRKDRLIDQGSASLLLKVYWSKKGDRWMVRDYEYTNALNAFFDDRHQVGPTFK